MEGKDLGVRESQDRKTLLNIIRQKNKILTAVSILFIYLTDQNQRMLTMEVNIIMTILRTISASNIRMKK